MSKTQIIQFTGTDENYDLIREWLKDLNRQIDRFSNDIEIYDEFNGILRVEIGQYIERTDNTLEMRDLVELLPKIVNLLSTPATLAELLSRLGGEASTLRNGQNIEISEEDLETLLDRAIEFWCVEDYELKTGEISYQISNYWDKLSDSDRSQVLAERISQQANSVVEIAPDAQTVSAFNREIVAALVSTQRAIVELSAKVEATLLVAQAINERSEIDPELEKHLNTSTLSAVSELLSNLEWMSGLLNNIQSSINEAQTDL